VVGSRFKASRSLTKQQSLSHALVTCKLASQKLKVLSDARRRLVYSRHSKTLFDTSTVMSPSQIDTATQPS
jgi:hypothetical protein